MAGEAIWETISLKETGTAGWARRDERVHAAPMRIRSPQAVPEPPPVFREPFTPRELPSTLISPSSLR
jgi:hypothetical protein